MFKFLFFNFALGKKDELEEDKQSLSREERIMLGENIDKRSQFFSFGVVTNSIAQARKKFREEHPNVISHWGTRMDKLPYEKDNTKSKLIDD